MEYQLRRTSRKIENDEALGILRRCTWGFLSIVGPNATPYGVPLNYALLEQDGEKHLIFHCAPEGRKLDYLKLQPQAAFVAVEGAETLPDKFSTAYASAMVSGSIEIVEHAQGKPALSPVVRCGRGTPTCPLGVQGKTYSREWIVGRHGYKTPAAVRAIQKEAMIEAA